MSAPQGQLSAGGGGGSGVGGRGARSARAWCCAALALLVIGLTTWKITLSSRGGGKKRRVPTPPPAFCHTFDRAATGAWVEDTWVPADRCRLLPLDELGAARCLRGRRVVMVGDSQMALLFRHLATRGCGSKGCYSSPLDCKIDSRFTGSRCDEGRGYYKVPGALDPDMMPEGEGCKGCVGCESRLMTCEGGGTFEFLGVPRVRDDVVTGTRYPTTQEVAFLWHLSTLPTPDLVLFNAGLHDTSRLDGKSYEEALRWYVSVLRRGAPSSRLVWVDTTGVASELQPRQWRNLTSNAKISEFNAKAEVVMGEQRIDILRASHLTRSDLYTDGVHLHGTQDLYYRTLLWALLSVECTHITPSDHFFLQSVDEWLTEDSPSPIPTTEMELLRLEEQLPPLDMVLPEETEVAEVAAPVAQEPSLAKESSSVLPLCDTVESGSHGDWNRGENWTWVPQSCVLRNFTREEAHRCVHQKRWVFIGDSQAVNLYRHFTRRDFHHRMKLQYEGLLRCWPDRKRAGDRCGEGFSFYKIEGAVNYKTVEMDRDEKKLAFCKHCDGCNSVKSMCGNKTDNTTLELLGIEKIYDRTVQGKRFFTTAENAFLIYLADRPPELVVFNAGVHDAAEMDVDEYAVALDWYLGLLLRVLGGDASRLVWIETSPLKLSKPSYLASLTQAHKVKPIRNDKIAQFNEVAGKLMAEKGVAVLASTQLEDPVLHSDDVHMHRYADAYYKALANIIWSARCR